METRALCDLCVFRGKGFAVRLGEGTEVDSTQGYQEVNLWPA